MVIGRVAQSTNRRCFILKKTLTKCCFQNPYSYEYRKLLQMHFICWWKELKHKLVQFRLKQFSSLGKSLTDHVDAWLNIFVFQLPMQTLWLHYLCLTQPCLKYKLSALSCNSLLQGCSFQRTCTSLPYFPFKFCSILVTELIKIKTKKPLLQSYMEFQKKPMWC